MVANQELNRCFLRFEDRAERITPKQIAETFVSVGPMMDVLESRNNQIMYGRRGTGKTHALRYFQNQRNAGGDLAIYVDCQNIGSNGSIYNDTTLPIAERATRLLIDVCSAIHGELLDIFTDPKRGWDLADSAEVLDEFADSFSERRIEGTTERQRSEQSTHEDSDGANIGVEAAGPAFGMQAVSRQSDTATTATKETGQEVSWITFGRFSRAVRGLASHVAPKRLWLLLDEWSTVPRDIQPYLADLIRRAMFSVPNITVKVAAIEHRSTFRHDLANQGYVGFELGADISAALNLDDYLVFDNNESRSRQFFQNFIENHTRAIAAEIGVDLEGVASIRNVAFTQDNVFTEFVKATEGVPRDAMHILATAAQNAGAHNISMPVVRQAALNFFQKDKYQAIQTNPDNRLLLEWIRDEVIGTRRTRAFMLPVGTEDLIIDRLFDRRALHIISRSMSAAHRPGERFIVYKLDYGLYVDLINTDKYPEYLLVFGNFGWEFSDVPDDDGRSYRRAVLDLNEFYAKNPNVASTAPR